MDEMDKIREDGVSIRILKDTRKSLKELKKGGNSYDDVIQGLLDACDLLYDEPPFYLHTEDDYEIYYNWMNEVRKLAGMPSYEDDAKALKLLRERERKKQKPL